MGDIDVTHNPSAVSGPTITLLCAAYLQVVRHRENSRYAIGADIRHVLVRLIIHIAFERDVPVVHDDVNPLDGVIRVFAELRFAIDRAIFCATNAIVVGRWGAGR